MNLKLEKQIKRSFSFLCSMGTFYEYKAEGNASVRSV